jgi:hypothetical protein
MKQLVSGWILQRFAKARSCVSRPSFSSSNICGRATACESSTNQASRIQGHSDVLGTTNVPRTRTTTRTTWKRLGQAAFFFLGLCFINPAFAERLAPKADDKVDRRMEEEANLPIYHMPLKEVHASGLSKNQSETKLLPLRQPQNKSTRLATAPGRSKTGEPVSPLAKARRLDSSNPKTLAKLDSLVQTQDKARQRALYGFKQDETHTTLSQPALAQEAKKSIEHPVVVPPPQTTVKKIPILPANAGIWTRNDSVPHRGPGTSSLGGPASIRNTGISGTGVKIRP